MPDGLTHVILADAGISSFFDISSLVFLASSLNLSNILGSGLDVNLLSIMPVNDTPNSLSSSVFLTHSADKN